MMQSTTASVKHGRRPVSEQGGLEARLLQAFNDLRDVLAPACLQHQLDGHVLRRQQRKSALVVLFCAAMGAILLMLSFPVAT